MGLFKKKIKSIEKVLDSADKKGIKNAYLDFWIRDAIRRSTSFENKRILEIGCGVGRMAAALAPFYSSYIGYDISCDYIEKARNLNLANTKFELSDGSIGSLPEYDIALFVWVLMYFFNDEDVSCYSKTLAESISIGGKVIIFEQHMPEEVVEYNKGIEYCVYRDVDFYNKIFGKDFSLVEKRHILNRRAGVFYRLLMKRSIYDSLPKGLKYFSPFFVWFDNLFCSFLLADKYNNGKMDILYIYEKSVR